MKKNGWVKSKKMKNWKKYYLFMCVCNSKIQKNEKLAGN